HVAEGEEQRRREHQQHHGAVHREQLVEGLVADELTAGAGELGADDERQDAAEQEEREGRRGVHLTDDLVVGGRQQRERLLAERALLGDGRLGGAGSVEGCGCHQSSESVSASLSMPSTVVVRVAPCGRPTWPASSRSARCARYSSGDTTLTLKSMRVW